MDVVPGASKEQVLGQPCQPATRYVVEADVHDMRLLSDVTVGLPDLALAGVADSPDPVPASAPACVNPHAG